jgi:hypothetical protein
LPEEKFRSVTLTVQHIHLANACEIDGVLVYAGDGLIAVLSQLLFDHDERAGRWFLEYGFGAAVDGHADFIDIGSACIWIGTRLAEQMARRPPERSMTKART